MAKGYGNLLVTAEGMEIAHVVHAQRDRVVCDFFSMKAEAERYGDHFYALNALFSQQFSYGDFYTGFLYRPWDDFHADKVLSGISQNTHQLIQSFSQNIMMKPLDREEEFVKTDEPRAHTGYFNAQGYCDFVGCQPEWEEWHRCWYAAHPSDIDWGRVDNEWLPRQDLILRVLKRELLRKFAEDGLKPEDAKLKLAGIADKDVANLFHEQVMRHKGSQLEAYASKVGGEICRCNYYTYEAELSDLERQYAKSLREIYSIVNRSGKRQFISIDFGHGMFEFHNENGEHQGEFRFDGSYNSPAEIDHGIKCMEQWHKQTGK